MVGCSRSGLPTWITAATRVDFDGASSSSPNASKPDAAAASSPAVTSALHVRSSSSEAYMGYGEKALSAAGAAVISAVLTNPLDVAKTRLQAQAAGVAYYPMQHQFGRRMASLGPSMTVTDFRCSPSCTRATIFGIGCPPDCFHYKDTMDVIYKVVRQEGFGRLWRGTNAGLALAVPTVGIYLPCYDIFRDWIEKFTASNAPSLTPYAPLAAGSFARSLACITCSPIELARTRMQAYKELQTGVKPPGILKTLLRVPSSLRSTYNNKNLQGYGVLWTGVGAQLARDVPFSAICWSTLEPIRRRLLSLVGDEGNVASVLGANFSAGFVAGSIAAFATCPLDVAKTRRQIEKDPARALNMSTRQTLVEIWRSAGVNGLFTGVGPRVGRAGPSVGIVVSFYEVVKHMLHQRNIN